MSTVEYAIRKELPVTHEADVVVIGGGPGGLGAAVLAARAGAKVLLVERYSILGGMATMGEVHPFMWNHIGPDGTERVSLDSPVYLDWLQKMTAYWPACSPNARMDHRQAFSYRDHIISKEIASLAAEDLCLEAGVQLLYHHHLADVIMDGETIQALVLFSKSGYTAVKAKMYVDCSGDADLAAKAGCPFEFGGDSGYCQPMTLCFKLCKVDRLRKPDGKTITQMYLDAKARGEIDCPREDILTFDWFAPDVIHFNTTRVIKHDGTNGVELSDAEIIARRQMRQLLAFFRAKVPGFEHCEIFSMANHIGIRETRRVKGLAYLTREDFIKRNKFADAIARVNYPVDIHNPGGSGTEMIHMDNNDWYEIPYGCIVPQRSKNLLVGGRPISVDHAIHSSMRVMPPACSVGQAAGVAATMAAESGKTPAELDGKAVRAKLVSLGANLAPCTR